MNKYGNIKNVKKEFPPKNIAHNITCGSLAYHLKLFVIILFGLVS